MRLRILALALVAAVSGTAAGAIENAGGAGKRPGVPAAAEGRAACPLPPRLRTPYRAAAADAGIPLPLLVAVARVEARDARPARLDLAAPANVLAGARYLRQLLDRFQSANLALAAYAAGPTAVARKGAAPDGATGAYVANVTREWRRLGDCS